MSPMPLYSDEAIVLRTHKLAEADRIITLLTRQHGVVRAVAKGVRRTSSRFGSRLEPFTHVDLQLAVGRNLDTITQAETRAPYGAVISADYDRYTAASVMLETAERLVSEERQPSVQQYLLLVGALRAMTAGEHRAGDVLDSFLLQVAVGGGLRAVVRGLRQLRARGAAPRVQPGRRRDAVPDLPGARVRRVPRPETLLLLGALLAGDWPVVDAAEQRNRREARGLVSAYVSWHLERGLRSLPYVGEG